MYHISYIKLYGIVELKLNLINGPINLIQGKFFIQTKNNKFTINDN
jgi:hypothetical protein